MQFPFLKNKDPKKNFFLSLLIKPSKIGAILFEEINSKLFILSTHEIETEKDTKELSADELLLSCDKVISFVESSLPESSTVEKTIFSVPYNWVEEGKIKKEYLLSLKKICEELGIIPIGYLMSIEAIVHFLQKTEGAPISAIFVEVAHNEVFVYLVRAGKILEVHSGVVEEGVLETTENLLKKINSVDVLPSKIILLDYKEVEGAQQQFISHQWKKDIPFLHLPQVVVLEKGFENEAAINGVASQMELEVLSEVHVNKEAPEKEELLEKTDPSEFGFLKEKDVAAAKKETEHKNNLEDPQPSVSYFKEEKKQEEEITPESKTLPIPLNFNISFFSSFLKNLKIPKINISSVLQFNNGAAKTKLIAGLIILIAFIGIISFLYYNLIESAQISVFADKKGVDKTADITFSQNPSDKNSIKIDYITQEIKGEDTKNSTGKKETGDKAKGNITIYNKTEDEKTFPKGTILTGPSGLEFETLSDIKIASTSSFSTSLSSSSVNVAAGKFGKEYNLPSGSNFTVKGFSSSDYIAKNSNALTGGTKKETTVVSNQDLDDLASSVTSKLEKDAISKAQSQKASNTEILSKALTFEIAEKKYTKKEGDESGNVGISADIKFTLGKYDKKSVDDIVESLSTGEIPGTYALIEGDSKVEITDLKVDGKEKSAAAKLKVNAVYSPKIESSKLALAIKGKTAEGAKKQIGSIAGVTDVTIAFKRTLPFFPKLLPQNIKNINIEVRD